MRELTSIRKPRTSLGLKASTGTKEREDEAKNLLRKRLPLLTNYPLSRHSQVLNSDLTMVGVREMKMS